MSRPMLVVGLSRTAEAHEVALLKAQWEEHCPDVELLVIAGVTSMVLMPATEEDE